MIELWYYVYTLRYPDNVFFYVGHCKENRINQHEKVALNLKEISIKSAKIIQAYLKDEKIIKQYEAWFKVKQHAEVYEAMLIDAYGLDNLTNKSKGVKKRSLEINDKAELRLNNINNDIYKNNDIDYVFYSVSTNKLTLSDIMNKYKINNMQLARRIGIII